MDKKKKAYALKPLDREQSSKRGPLVVFRQKWPSKR